MSYFGERGYGKRGGITVGQPSLSAEEALAVSARQGIDWIYEGFRNEPVGVVAAIGDRGFRQDSPRSTTAATTERLPIENDTDRDYLREAIDIIEDRSNEMPRPAHLRALYLALETLVRAARLVPADEVDSQSVMKVIAEAVKAE